MSYNKRIFFISTVLFITITTAFSGEFDFPNNNIISNQSYGGIFGQA